MPTAETICKGYSITEQHMLFVANWTNRAWKIVCEWNSNLPKGYVASKKPELDKIFNIVWGKFDNEAKQYRTVSGLSTVIEKYFFKPTINESGKHTKALVSYQNRRLAATYSKTISNLFGIPAIVYETALLEKLKHIAKIYKALSKGNLHPSLIEAVNNNLPQEQSLKGVPKKINLIESIGREKIIKLYFYLNKFLEAQNGAREYKDKRPITIPFLDRTVSSLMFPQYTPKQVKKIILDAS